MTGESGFTIYYTVSLMYCMWIQYGCQIVLKLVDYWLRSGLYLISGRHFGSHIGFTCNASVIQFNRWYNQIEQSWKHGYRHQNYGRMSKIDRDIACFINQEAFWHPCWIFHVSALVIVQTCWEGIKYIHLNWKPSKTCCCNLNIYIPRQQDKCGKKCKNSIFWKKV